MTLLFLILLLIVFPALIGYFLFTERLADNIHGSQASFWDDHINRILHKHFHPGDYLIYRKPKASQRPGPRALNIHAARERRRLLLRGGQVLDSFRRARRRPSGCNHPHRETGLSHAGRWPPAQARPDRADALPSPVSLCITGGSFQFPPACRRHAVP